MKLRAARRKSKNRATMRVGRGSLLYHLVQVVVVILEGINEAAVASGCKGHSPLLQSKRIGTVNSVKPLLPMCKSPPPLTKKKERRTFHVAGPVLKRDGKNLQLPF